MPRLLVSVAPGDDVLSVRRFTVEEALNTPFTVSLWTLSANDALDLDAIVGKAASFRLDTENNAAPLGGARRWTGVCSYIEQTQAEPTGLSTYFLRIVPELWLLTQRRGYRVFQHVNIPDIVDKILGEWSITPVWKIERARYPKLEYRVQYGESDYDLVARLLEEAGIALIYTDARGAGTALTLADGLHTDAARATPPLSYLDKPNKSLDFEWVTAVRISHEVRPGAYTIRDHDFRNPAFPLFGDATKAAAPEDRYEQYRYQPGAFLIEGGKAGDTPVADDKGIARHDQKAGADRAERALQAERAPRRVVAFESNTVDLWPGMAFSIDGHPHVELGDQTKLLLSEMHYQGAHDDTWDMFGRAFFVAPTQPYRPQLRTPKPVVSGVQSATVVGPKGQEIHTDEFGRVRVQFPWDREGKDDDGSSCWIRVSQGWAGTGFGLLTLPRVGQEVLIGFLAGDPDDPIVVGRVFNATNKVPYKLPEHKTRSTWKSNSSPSTEGFNEIMFEDLAGKELVWMQAQKNLRKLVKNDETITVGHDRQKLVKNDETETTGGTRTEVVGNDRVEITSGDRTTVIGGSHAKLVKFDEVLRTEGDLLLYVGKDQHLVVKEERRELIEKDSHLHVMGSRNEEIDGASSLSAGSHQEKVGGKLAIGVTSVFHIKAGSALVIEAVADLTLKGPGGFIRIDGGGVTIAGNLVRINSGGGPGSADDAKPGGPKKPREAVVPEPKKPEPDDLSKTGIGQ
jgi:type VI secretion system secreted protein VgrG